ncbi:DUF7289 family protein [Halomicrobium salinisoli]|uniref:DUF7289 family protein n=1 Tax=Halomicrobium salinisoli TaxID=2878391 RepID=UPI001CEFE452|nr:polymer-forming cytoskeletal protein [Halomicrobium salinisoli]
MGGREKRGRSQSSVLGVALLFAIVIAVSVSVVLVGTQALEQRQQATSTESVRASFQQLDASLTQVATGSQRRASVPTLDGTNAKVQGNHGHVTINVSDGSGGNCTVVDADLGRVVYEGGGSMLAYQGGGVFERTAGADGSRVVSAPEIRYQDRGGTPTLSMPLVLVDGSAAGTEFAFERAGRADRFPTASCPSPNPIPDGRNVTVTVESEFYRAWGTVFERQGDGDLEYDHDERRVTVRLGSAGGSGAGGDGPVGPLVSTSGELQLDPQSQFDSYDSDDGPYASQSPGEATVYADGDLTLKAEGTIRGDLNATGDVELRPQAEVTGTIYHGGSLTTRAGTAYGDEERVAPRIPTVADRDDEIDSRVTEISSENNNSDESSNITKLRNRGCSPSCTLPEGEYYVPGFDHSGTLYLEPEGGQIAIAAPDGLNVVPGSTIEVVGDGRVVVYSQGDTDIEQSRVGDTTDDDATQFWLYQRSDTHTRLGPQLQYVGVVHAGPDGEIRISSNPHGDIYGAVLGSVSEAEAARAIHYDRALVDAGRGGGYGGGGGDGVAYLHVTTTTVEAES